MPEMPEVEGLRRHVAAALTEARVRRCDLASIAVLKSYDPPLSDLVGGQVVEVCRFGKFLAVSVHAAEQPLWLVFHLARAGWLRLRPAGAKPPRLGGKGPLLLRVGFDNDLDLELTEAGTQRHAAVWLVRDPAEIDLLAELGPDPLSDDFTAASLARVLQQHAKARLKTVLRDQRAISGIGNGWSDEILHTARLSPYTAAGSLDEDAVERLWTVIREVLHAATQRASEADPDDLRQVKKSQLRVHGHTGESCPVCRGVIAEVSFSDSSWQYCPTCQTDGALLADRRMSRLLK